MENKIKAIRDKTGLSQAKFGALYGIPKRTIENWESEVTRPPGYVIHLLELVVDNELIKPSY